MQVLVSGDRHEIYLYFICDVCHVRLSCTDQVAVKGLDDGAEDDGRGLPPVLAGGPAVGLLEGAGKRLVAGKAVIQRDLQKAPGGIPHFLQRERQGAVAQIIPEVHPGNFTEFAGNIKFGKPQLLRKRGEGQRLIVALPDVPVNILHDSLYHAIPFVHSFLCLL